VQDRDALEALDTGKARWPTLREGVYDGAFAAERCCAWSNLHGMRHRVVARDPAARGFVALARRWVVERSFGWLSHGGGLARVVCVSVGRRRVAGEAEPALGVLGGDGGEGRA
jgi:transposase